MKKYIYIVIIFFSSFLCAGITDTPFSTTIDEYKTDIYFGNGVWNDIDGAGDGQTKLNGVMQREIIKDNPHLKKKSGEVKLSYNWGKGYMEDVLETYYQLREAGQVNNLEFFALILIVIKGNAVVSAAATAALIAKLPYSADTEQKNIDKMLTNYYLESFQWSHRVLLVSHSQGNLFANRIYDSLSISDYYKGYEKYFTNVQVGSPASSIHAPEGKYITNRGDLIINPIPGSMPGNANPDSENVVLPACLDAVIHLDYNKSKEICSSIVDNHQFVPFYLGQSDPLSQIIPAIRYQLEALKWRPSQWKPKKQGCSCKTKYAKVTHLFDDEANILMGDKKVKDFKEDAKGKIYQVDGKYVRAEEGGMKIEEVQESETCFILKNENDIRLGEIKGISEMPDAELGAITVALDWKNTDVNLDLDVRWEEGEYDIKDIACPKEHWLIQNKSSVTEGRREIWIDLKEISTNDVNLSDQVIVDIQALGREMPLVIDINEESDYEIGHIADIVIQYVNNKIVPKLELSPNLKPNVHSASGTSSNKVPRSLTCEETYGEYDCQCIPCAAKIIPYLEQALVGPLSGADLRLYEAEKYADEEPIYTGMTSVGNSIITAGIIDIAKSITDALEDDRLYLVEAHGGLDIDSNDDYIIDEINVANEGRLRALVSGKDIKDHGYKINLLTEIAYQVVKNKIGKVLDTEIRKELDEIAQYLLRAPIYMEFSDELSYKDIMVWLPTFDKKLLFYDYDEKFEPIVQKIYRDQDIYDDTLALVYGPMEYPRLKSLHLNVSENIENGAYIGAIEIVSQGNSDIQNFTLDGEGSENFRIDLNGSISVSDVALIDFETKQKYKLKATATNFDGNITVGLNITISDVYDAPVATGYEGGILFSTATSSSWVAQVIFDPGKADIERIELIGNGSGYFDINTSGDIIVSALGLPQIKENTKFHFDVVAENAYGRSRPAGITIHINAVKDIPSLHGFTAYVDEHAHDNTLIHTLSVAEGTAPIDAFVLSGDGSENFVINNLGQLRVSENADIDYEKRTDYILSLGARNIHGISDNVKVYIFVNDRIDVPVLKKNKQFNVDENETSEWLIGNILKEKGLSNVSSMKLSNALFTVDLEGNIYLSEGQNLDYETEKIHRITVTASNSYGDSLPVEFIINVNDLVDSAMVNPFTAFILENTTIDDAIGQVSYSKGTSEVELFQLFGIGSEKFEVDKDGVVKVKSNTVFNYEEASIYNLRIRALNASGYGEYADFTIHIENLLDAPELQALSWSMDENTKSIILNGNIILNEGLSAVSTIVVRDNKGDISKDIEVHLDGKVHVLLDADLDYEKGPVREYDAIAYNDQGFSNSVVLRLNLKNVLDAPELEEFSGSIDENVVIGTAVGDISFDPGLSEVLEMSLEVPNGADYINPFTIDKFGKISVQNKLDYETKSSYRLMAFARNDHGVSSPSFVSIKIYNNEDGPVLNPFSGSIKEDADFGEVVGNITYKEGLDPIVSMSLSGEGSENFMIDKSGNITLADGAKLDFELKNEYNIWAQAFSLGDDSGIVDVTIIIRDVNENARAGVGLWSNAVVNIYRLEDDGNQTLLFTELTGDSDEYNQTGLFDSHRLELEDNKFYIYEAKNGIERDADQDGILDENITSHSSALYAILKGEWIRHMQKPLSINLMTDAFYQWLKDDVMAANYMTLEEKLQEPYNPIIRRDIDGTLHNTFNWNYGDGRDALVYDPVDDVNTWKYLFNNSTRLFMRELVLSSQQESYRFFVKNTLFANSEKIKRNDENILDISNYLRYDLRYVSFGEGGEYYVDIVDISDINNTVVLSEMWLDDRGGSSSKILSNDKNRYLSVNSDIVYRYDVSDSLNPIGDTIQILWAGEINRAIFSSDDTLLYIANGSAGVWLVDTLNFNPKSYKVFLENCIDVQEMNENTIAALVSNDIRSSLEILDISDRENMVHTLSLEINSSNATTFLINQDQTLMFVGGDRSRYPYLDIYRVNDNPTPQEFFSSPTLLSSPINGYYGKVIEIKLMDGENEIIVTTEYYRLKYNIFDINKPVLLEKVQLQKLPT